MAIPNNIGLDERGPASRLLEEYERKFRGWWGRRGPTEFLERSMRLRLPTGATSAAEWSKYHTMKPADYRWGVFMIPDARNEIAFGDHRGQARWNEAPSEYRSLLLQHICVQADVENAAVEQSSTLTRSTPSALDLENLFQFYLEEARHTWAMSHLLLTHFGEDGLVEAERLLERLSGDAENPRLLEAFNHPTEDWLSHYMWCLLADRVGKYQLHAVTDASFAPLARAARFMMLEEPLHISFGTLGLERVLCRSLEAMRELKSEDVFRAGAIPLAVIQKYFNFWLPKVYDLFGNDESERARELLRAGIRIPRNFREDAPGTVAVDRRSGEQIERCLVSGELATNTLMRRQFIAELQKILDRWNAVIRTVGIDFTFSQPHERFARRHGPCAHLPFDNEGNRLQTDASHQFFPSGEDLANVRGLMERKLGPEECASWIAPPGTRLHAVSGA
ncbi:MAG: benzoyl-CoA 2,3-epoxidase subunit BoxB [Myxococcales bacterium]|nr:MAG: benzoyl-CoA 2,3-epoxidase subunit BoxB [Myxococcales bacterium]